MKEKTDKLATKIGKLPVQGVKLDDGSTLFAVSWLKLPKEQQTAEIGQTLSEAGFAHFKISDKSVLDDQGRETGKWYLFKDCVNVRGNSNICFSERIFVNNQTLYRILTWRNDINKNSSAEMDGFVRLSERFFDGFQISAKQSAKK